MSSTTKYIHLPQASTDRSSNANSRSSDLQSNHLLDTQSQQTMPKPVYEMQPFPANIEIEVDPHAATHFAHAEYSTDLDPHEGPKRQRMVFWSNSRSSIAGRSRYGIGVAYVHGRNRWVDLEYQILREVKDWVAEIAAISKALQIAAEEVSRAISKPTVVVVYTGARRALERMKKGVVGLVPGQKFLLKPGMLAAEKIRDCGIAVELRWGPNTELVQGSRRASHAARRGANYTPSAGECDRILEVRSSTKRARARARARARSRPPAVSSPDIYALGLGLSRLELIGR